MAKFRVALLTRDNYFVNYFIEDSWEAAIARGVKNLGRMSGFGEVTNYTIRPVEEVKSDGEE